MWNRLFGSKQEPVEPRIEDTLADFIPEDYLQEIYCSTLSSCSMFSLRPKQGKQEKVCQFINCQLSLGNHIMDKHDGGKQTVAVINIENEDFDPEQDQQQFESLPITEELRFMRYKDGSEWLDGEESKEEIHGFVFFYPGFEEGIVKIVEITITNDEVRRDAERLCKQIAQVLYVVNEQKHLLLTGSNDLLRTQDKKVNLFKYEVSLATLMNQPSIVNMYADLPKSVNNDKRRNLVQTRMREQQLTQQLDRENKTQILTKKLSELKVGQEDLRNNSDYGFVVLERLVQAIGHFGKFDVACNSNIGIVESVFIAIDRVDDGPNSYVINVLDQAQKVSYTCTRVTTDKTFSFEDRSRTLLWTGEKRSNGEIPCWYFFLSHEKQVKDFRAGLTKALLETQFREANAEGKSQSSEGDGDNNDQQWQESALLGGQQFDDSSLLSVSSSKSESEVDDDQDYDIEMSDLQRIQELDFKEAEMEKDVEPQFKDHENRELIQAVQYDRAFCIKGSIIRLFNNPDDASGDQFSNRLEQIGIIKPLRDDNGAVFEPQNLVFHNNESSLLFSDKNNPNRIVNYDMECGKVVNQFKLDGEISQKLLQFTNECKDSAGSDQNIFTGITNNAFLTLDARLASRSKIANQREYKKPPNFSVLTTTSGGGFAIGGTDGKIRLYKKGAKDANAILPGLSDPILHLEVTRDSKWILATTQTYLLLIPTELVNGKTGFEQRMTNQKPVPIKLELLPTDIATNQIYQVKFKAARFNNHLGGESHIVTSTGDNLITWDFKEVRAGKRSNYKITKLLSKPVDCQFRINTDDKIIVTDESKVGLQIRRKKQAIKY